jgi:hypothetical protein
VRAILNTDCYLPFSPAVAAAKDADGFEITVNGYTLLTGLMNGQSYRICLDFDGDGVPDRAYGDGYIGLRSSEAVTGPKMRRYRGTPYWYAIALHGTPDPSSLGEARSGGCVHLPASLLEQLVTGDHIQLGTQVIIADGPPLPLDGVGGGAVP